MKKIQWQTDCFIRTGTRHTAKGQPCQDYVMCVDNCGVALCDGVSSCEMAEKASEVVVIETLRILKNLADNKTAVNDLIKSPQTKREEVYRIIAHNLTETVKEKLAEYPKADATLTFAYLLNGQFALIGYVGDSAVISFSKNGAKVYTQTQDHGGATESICHSCAAEWLDIQLVDMKAEDTKAFLLTSDGLEDILYTKGSKAHAAKMCEPFVNSVFEPGGHNNIDRLLSEIAANPEFDDDISVAILAKEEIAMPNDPKWLCKCGHRNRMGSFRCEHCRQDFFSLYRNSNIKAFPSVWEFFTYLNAHPEEEQFLLHHSAAKVPAYEEPTVLYAETDVQPENSSTDLTETKERNKQPKCSPNHTPTVSSRLALALSALILLLCGVVVMNFFMMTSISSDIGQIKTELEMLKYADYTTEEATEETFSTSPETSSPISTEPSTATHTPTEATSAVKIPATDTMLEVTETTTLYPSPKLDANINGYATKADDITLIDRKTVEGIEWLEVKTSSHIIGWAPAEYFKTIKETAPTS